MTERKEWPIAWKTLLEASSGWHDIGEGEVGERVMGVRRPVGWKQRDGPDLVGGKGRRLAETRTGLESRVAANAPRSRTSASARNDRPMRAELVIVHAGALRSSPGEVSDLVHDKKQAE